MPKLRVILKPLNTSGKIVRYVQEALRGTKSEKVDFVADLEITTGMSVYNLPRVNEYVKVYITEELEVEYCIVDVVHVIDPKDTDESHVIGLACRVSGVTESGMPYYREGDETYKGEST